MNIEALCAAPPEALAHSPSLMPLSCPVAPHLSASCTKTAAAAAVVAWRGGRAPPGPRKTSPAPRPVSRPPQRPPQRPAPPAAAAAVVVVVRGGGPVFHRHRDRWTHMHEPGCRRGGPARWRCTASALRRGARPARPPIGEGLDEPVRRRWKMAMGKISAFTLPFSAALDTSSTTFCATSCAMSCAASFMHGRLCASNAK